jgi:hypothetical protein
LPSEIWIDQVTVDLCLWQASCRLFSPLFLKRITGIPAFRVYFPWPMAWGRFLNKEVIAFTGDQRHGADASLRNKPR